MIWNNNQEKNVVRSAQFNTRQKLRSINVVLFPDGNAYDKWMAKANELSSIARFQVSNLLETFAGADSKQQGLDLADYLG